MPKYQITRKSFHWDASCSMRIDGRTDRQTDGRTDGRTDGQTDGHEEANNRLLQLCKRV
jgi:hypothetical protein